MGKTVIAPLVGVLFLIIQALFGVSIADDVQAEIIDALAILIAAGVTVYGVFKNHTKKTDPDAKL